MKKHVGLLFFIPLLGMFSCLKDEVITSAGGKIREYYVAAEVTLWDYAPSNEDLIHGGVIPAPWTDSHIFNKILYVEYTDKTFSVKKQKPEWLGLMGPIIRGEVGDSILVHFYNKTHLGPDSLKLALTVHPHGVNYDKTGEGAHYGPVTFPGSMVMPGEKYTYRWFADEDAGPGPSEGSSRCWWYHSHIDEPLETNLGLLGALVINRKGMSKPDGTPKDVDKEFLTMYMVFDELGGEEAGLMHGINGYIFGNLQGLVAKKGDKVRWYLMAMGNEIDLHTPHWHGQTITVNGTHTDVEELLPGSMETADMVCDNPGTWLMHCHVADHISAGMVTTFTVEP